jgi:hypothetical protein
MMVRDMGDDRGTHPDTGRQYGATTREDIRKGEMGPLIRSKLHFPGYTRVDGRPHIVPKSGQCPERFASACAKCSYQNHLTFRGDDDVPRLIKEVMARPLVALGVLPPGFVNSAVRSPDSGVERLTRGDADDPERPGSKSTVTEVSGSCRTSIGKQHRFKSWSSPSSRTEFLLSAARTSPSAPSSRCGSYPHRP